MRKLLFIGCLTVFLSIGGAAEKNMLREAARLNVYSLPAVAQSASNLGNLVAPGFADSVVLLTVILGMNPQTAQWDFTRPFSVVFHDSPDQNPAVLIQAVKRPNAVETDTTLRIGPLRFELEYQGSHIFARTPNLTRIPPQKTVAKTKDSTLALEILTVPPLLKKQFEFAALAAGSSRKLPAATDDFIQSFRTLNLTVRVPSPERIRLTLSGVVQNGSPFVKYLSHPPPLSGVEIFEEAEELFLLNIPADSAFRRQLHLFLPSYMRSAQEDELRNALIEAMTGEISCSVRLDRTASAGNIPEIKAVLRLRGNMILKLKRKLELFEETPFDGYRVIAREKTPFAADQILYAKLSGDRIIFLAGPMEHSSLERMMKTKFFFPDVNLPFSIYDLKSGQRIAGMEFRNNTMRLDINAEKSFFQQFPSIVNQPIHKLNLKKKR